MQRGRAPVLPFPIFPFPSLLYLPTFHRFSTFPFPAFPFPIYSTFFFPSPSTSLLCRCRSSLYFSFSLNFPLSLSIFSFLSQPFPLPYLSPSLPIYVPLFFDSSRLFLFQDYWLLPNHHGTLKSCINFEDWFDFEMSHTPWPLILSQ